MAFGDSNMACTSRSVVGLLVSFLVLLACGPDGADRNAPRDTVANDARRAGTLPAASFDWSMPDRLRFDHATNSIVSPSPGVATWTVNFDACASVGRIVGYRWDFDDLAGVQSPIQCRISHTFESEGVYSVVLTVIDESGATATAVRDVTVQDFLIVAMGDSYGSGEGNPDVPIADGIYAEWLAANRDFAQASFEIAEAEHVLELVSRIRPHVDELIIANERLVSAHERVALYCGLLVPFVCEKAQYELWKATARVTKATDDLTLVLTQASVEAVLEGLVHQIPTPRNILARLDEIEGLFMATFEVAQATFNGAQAALDAIKGAAQRVSWQDGNCHRSAYAGQVQAALQLEAADPHTSVTLVDLSCSGATVSQGILGEYSDPPGGERVPAQLDAARGIVAGREVDALLLSIGGNDVGFGKIVMGCMTESPCYSRTFALAPLDEATATALCVGVAGPFEASCRAALAAYTADAMTSSLERFEDGLSGLDEQYAKLRMKMHEEEPLPLLGVGQAPSRVYITQYPDATQDEQGRTCGPRNDRADPLVTLPGFSEGEWSWAATTVTRDGLNAGVEAAAATPPKGTAETWTYVDGIFEAFARHGYCSDHTWFVRLQDSFLGQGDTFGTLHPNRAGQAAIGERILAALRRDLYPASSPAGAARPPWAIPIADAGGPWSVLEGSETALTNRSRDPSRAGCEFEWTLDLSPTGGARLSDPAASLPRLVALDDAIGTVTVRAKNPYGIASADAPVRVRNVAPTLAAGSDLQVDEGSAVALASTFVDPGELDSHEAFVDWGDGSAPEPAAVRWHAIEARHVYSNERVARVTVRVRDDDGGEGSGTLRVTVLEVRPVVGAISPASDEVRPGRKLAVSAPFTDPGVLDTHTAVWSWGDGTTSPGTLDEQAGAGTVRGDHTYASAGTYHVELVVTDDSGTSGKSQLELDCKESDGDSCLSAMSFLAALGVAWIGRPHSSSPRDAGES